MRRIISILLQNEVGALARVAGMFAARGYNIDSLTVAATHDPFVSRLTLVTAGDDIVIDQIIKQSRKLIDVIDIADLTSRDHIEFELLIVKVAVLLDRAAQLTACLHRHERAVLIGETETTRTIQFTGTGNELNSFLGELAAAARVVDLARSGTAALGGTETATSEELKLLTA